MNRLRKLWSASGLSVLLLSMTGCGDPQELPVDAPSEGTSRQEIIGGVNAEIVNSPWQVSIQSASGSHLCGGTIIHPSWVLTSQRCVAGTGFAIPAPSTLRVAAGSSTLSGMSSGGQLRSIDEIIPFKGYVTPRQGKDVALLHLSTPLDVSDPEVEPIALATAADEAAGYTSPSVLATVTGWGELTSGSFWPDRLQSANVRIVSNATASQIYGQPLTADQLATADMANGSGGACAGDDGGPLVVSKGTGKILAGVVSWRAECGDRTYPGMYARVSSFESWITSVIRSPLGTYRSVSFLSGAVGEWRDYPVNVSAGTPVLMVHMTGGTGNADLHVRAGGLPTTTSYDCRPALVGNSESCIIPNPTPGVWYVSAHGASSFSGVSLRATTYIAAGQPYAIRAASSGLLVTAVGGGGKGADHALHTDATGIGPYETFVLTAGAGVNGRHSIRTASGKYLSAANGGGVGGAGAMRTDASSVGPNESFELEWRDIRLPRYAIKTWNGQYLTAVAGGGQGTLNAIHTDATMVGPHEVFTLTHLGGSNYALKTASGNYVTAVGGGNVGPPDVIHTDATTIGSFERFTYVSQANDAVAIRTFGGYYLTATGGGGVGTAGAIHTNATGIGVWERFTLVDLGGRRYALRTSGGRYLTAVDGGGVSGPDAIHTDATSVGTWERFSFVPL